MYNSQETALRIKNIAKSKRISMELLNSACGLSKNAISQAGKSSDGMKAKNLYVIANYLEVSVDYLLGRTDDQNGYSSISNIDTTINGNQAHIINNISDSDLYDVKNLLGQLSKTDKHRAIADILDLLEEKYKQHKKSTP